MGTARQDRVRAEIVRLVHQGLGVREFSLAAAAALRRAVAFDGVCVLTFDPATLLPTGEVVENGLPEAARARMAEIEVAKEDVLKFTGLARARRPAASLGTATEGDLDRSLRHRDVRRPNGLGDELRAALVTDSGVWGGLALLREAGGAHFTPADVRFVASVSEHLAEGLRRAVLLAEPASDREEADAGLIVLADDDSVETTSRAAEIWLEELGAGGGSAGHLPLVVLAVANRARRAAADGSGEAAVARARVRARSGRWLLARGSRLGDGPDARTAVMLEAASSPDLAPLIAEAYGLTERERIVTQLVAQGLATSQIASRLHLSPYTVQDHLKSIFGKAGVSARGELVARLFFDHYAPRLTDGTPAGPSGWFAPTPAAGPPADPRHQGAHGHR